MKMTAWLLGYQYFTCISQDITVTNQAGLGKIKSSKQSAGISGAQDFTIKED